VPYLDIQVNALIAVGLICALLKEAALDATALRVGESVNASYSRRLSLEYNLRVIPMLKSRCGHEGSDEQQYRKFVSTETNKMTNLKSQMTNGK